MEVSIFPCHAVKNQNVSFFNWLNNSLCIWDHFAFCCVFWCTEAGILIQLRLRWCLVHFFFFFILNLSMEIESTKPILISYLMFVLKFFNALCYRKPAKIWVSILNLPPLILKIYTLKYQISFHSIFFCWIKHHLILFFG